MQLDRDSRLVKFSYLLMPERPVRAAEGYVKFYSNVPNSTSLCAFFWRTFVIMPILLLTAVGVVGMVLYLLGLFLVLFSVEVAIAIASTCSAAVLVILMLMYDNKYPISDKTRNWERRVFTKMDAIVDSPIAQAFWQGLKTLKGKVCPIITLK